jgi:hypothetical protein
MVFEVAGRVVAPAIVLGHELADDLGVCRWHHHLLLEAERLAQPVDRRASIPIAERRDDSSTSCPLDSTDHDLLLSLF